MIVWRMIEGAMRSNGTVVGLKNGQRSSPAFYTRLVYRVREMLSVLFILGADHQYHMSDGNGMGGKMCKQRSPSVLQKPLVIIRISLSDP
jgi:hypothetical protein